MKITPDRPHWHEVCVVCTKSTSSGRGFAQVNVEGAEIFLCCPGCVAAFDGKRDHYLTQREVLKPSEISKMG